MKRQGYLKKPRKKNLIIKMNGYNLNNEVRFFVEF